MIGQILFYIFLVLFVYCALSVLYLALFSAAGSLSYPRRMLAYRNSVPLKKIAILVPSYREDGIIFSTVNNLLGLDYPKELYKVYVIADSFQPQTISDLRSTDAIILEVAFDKSTKTKSLNEAFSRITGQYDVALICDADNMLKKDFLLRINDAFVSGAKAVQGRRVAKNMDSPFAILDACSEAINNHIFRKGANGLGLSSPIIGSGMAYGYEEVKSIMSSIKAVGGFDKILQLSVVKNGSKIYYLSDAIIFDEKVGNSQAFSQQRRRWVSSQFIYLRQFFLPAFAELVKGNFSYFNLAVANNIILPRAFLFIILPALLVAAFFFGTTWAVAAGVLLLVYLLTLLNGIPRAFYNRDLLQAIGRLPKAVLIMAGTVLHLKKANKTFIHTVHTKNEVGHTLYEDKL